MWSWLHTCKLRATGMCDVTSGSEQMSSIGAQSPGSANNGTWGKLLALSKSLHLHWHNLMIIVKIKAISQGYCETQILRCLKAYGKVSKTCMRLLIWVSRSKVQYPFSLSILSVLNNSDQSVSCLLLPQCDGIPQINWTFLVISVSKIQALVDVE